MRKSTHNEAVAARRNRLNPAFRGRGWVGWCAVRVFTGRVRSWRHGKDIRQQMNRASRRAALDSFAEVGEDTRDVGVVRAAVIGEAAPAVAVGKPGAAEVGFEHRDAGGGIEETATRKRRQGVHGVMAWRIRERTQYNKWMCAHDISRMVWILRVGRTLLESRRGAVVVGRRGIDKE